MIFKNRSNYMLKYEKAKAKLVEFNVKKEDYPRFQLDSTDLIYTILYVLSRYCEEIITNPNANEAHELFSELTIVAQYYDAATKSEQWQDYDNLFLLLGSTAYFLSENFGSARVLIDRIRNWRPNDNVMDLLYSTLRFLLLGEVYKPTWGAKNYIIYHEAVFKHFNFGDSPQAIYESLRRLYEEVDYSQNEIDITYLDFLYGISFCAINHSAWILLPKYSGIDSKLWREYLSSSGSIKLLWPAQKIVFQAGALSGNNIVVPLPTGVGKTKSLEIIIRSFFMRTGIRIALVVAPLRALCNEITSDLTIAFGDVVIINQFTDTTQEDFDLELIENTKYVFICTPEKFSYILRHDSNFLSSIGLFIFDEAHLFDDSSRGIQYELLMAEVARSRSPESQMILFSAVLSNSEQIGDWLFGNTDSVVDYSLVKSTEKSIGFLSADQTIHYYEKDDMSQESFYVPKSINTVQLRLQGRERRPRIFPDNNPQDLAIYYAISLCRQNGAAIFAGQVRSVAPIMRRIIDINNRGYDLTDLLKNGDRTQIGKLQQMFQLHYGTDSELTGAAKIGVFPHYANLPNGIKMAIEFALKKRHIHLVVCTTTLAESVNIPIKYLIITTFSYGESKIQIRKMQNLIGRTARSGIHTEGSAIVTDAKYFDNRSSWKGGGKYRWDDCKKMFDYGYTEACTSTLLELVSDFQVDYEKSFRGEALAAYLIAEYGNPLCFNNLKERLRDSYSKLVSQDRFERYSPIIDKKVDQFERILENVENYLCYVYNSESDSETFDSIVEDLANSTFAFYLADQRQKDYLKRIFSQIGEKIKRDIGTSSATYFAKSLYGIEMSKLILQWVNENLEKIEECSINELQGIVADLFVQLFPEGISMPRETFFAILTEWISGKLYVDIYRAFHNDVSIAQIERVCSNIISYDLSFLVGNIIDGIGNRSEKASRSLSFLQKQIKYGVSSQLQILVCENIFDDRYLARILEKMFGQLGIPLSEKDLKKRMRNNAQAVLDLLKDYPDFFTYRFSNFIK